MGRARIISTTPKTAVLDYEVETARMTRQHAEFEAELVEINAEIPKIEEAITAIEAELAESFALIDAATNSLSACIVAQDIEYRLSSTGSVPGVCMPHAEEIAKLQESAAPISAKLYFERQSLEQAKVRRGFVQAAIIRLDNALNSTEAFRNCHCADLLEPEYTPAPLATVGVIELWGGEGMPDRNVSMPVANLVLRPQHPERWPGAGGYQPARDHWVQPALDSESAMVTSHVGSWTWNQEFHPRYIVATIIGRNEYSGRVDVRRVVPLGLSAIPGVDYAWQALDVQVLYMTCDDRAFAVGDRVVVEFMGLNKTSPRVIGFETNPQACPPGALYVINPVNSQRYRLERTGGASGPWVATAQNVSVANVLQVFADRRGWSYGGGARNTCSWQGDSVFYKGAVKRAFPGLLVHAARKFDDHYLVVTGTTWQYATQAFRLNLDGTTVSSVTVTPAQDLSGPRWRIDLDGIARDSELFPQPTGSPIRRDLRRYQLNCHTGAYSRPNGPDDHNYQTTGTGTTTAGTVIETCGDSQVWSNSSTSSSSVNEAGPLTQHSGANFDLTVKIKVTSSSSTSRSFSFTECGPFSDVYGSGSESSSFSSQTEYTFEPFGCTVAVLNSNSSRSVSETRTAEGVTLTGSSAATEQSNPTVFTFHVDPENSSVFILEVFKRYYATTFVTEALQPFPSISRSSDGPTTGVYNHEIKSFYAIERGGAIKHIRSDTVNMIGPTERTFVASGGFYQKLSGTDGDYTSVGNVAEINGSIQRISIAKDGFGNYLFTSASAVVLRDGDLNAVIGAGSSTPADYTNYGVT